MQKPNRKIDRIEISMDYGRITSREDNYFIVETSGTELKAKKALNCLVEPEEGDMVLLSEDSFGRCYILSVLERETGKSVTLTFDEDVSLKVPEGRLQATAKEGIDLTSPKDVSIASSELSVNSVEGRIGFEKLSFISGYVEGHAEAVKLVAQAYDSIFERVSQRAKRSYRWISEYEQIRAEMMDYLAEKVMTLRAKYTVMSAEEDVRIDGDKILMG